jgi:murein DD-endopeptidase MepM/ murein hydrolase activator NlpD
MDVRTAHPLAAVALAAAVFTLPAHAQISAPPPPLKVTVVEPLDNGVAYYQRMAPSIKGGPDQARVHLRMRITNQSNQTLTLTQIRIFNTVVSNFVPPGSPLLNTPQDGQDDAVVQPVLTPGSTFTFANCNCDGAKPLAVNLPIADKAPIEISMAEIATKVTKSEPIVAWVPQALRWPGDPIDLRVNEGWNVTSQHIGWGQTFALDNQVTGWNGKAFSTLWPGAVNADKRKEDHRAYGMPVYASHEGIVCRVLRDHTEKMGVDSQEPTWSPSLGMKDGSGNSVKIRFGDYYVAYAHMQRWSIPDNIVVGSRIVRGQYLGKVGNSGSTSGPHLHFHVAKLTDPSQPSDSCEDGVIRPMGFEELQTITRNEATPLAKDGTLAAEHWNHVEAVAPPHAASVLEPTAEPVNFCADCTDAKSYLGVWNQGSGDPGIDLRVKIAGWTAFSEHWQRLSDGGFRLRKIETFVENGERQYVGVFKRGSGPYALWQGQGWQNFLNVWNDQYAQGAYLVDIESFTVGNARYYVGVFAEGTGVPSLIRVNSWSAFTSQWDTLSNDGKRLVDVETFLEGDKRIHIGVFEQGTGGYALRQLKGFSAFAADWKTQANAGYRLTSVESFVAGSDRWYIGVYRTGTFSQGLFQHTGWSNHWRKAEDLNWKDYRMTDVHVLQ